MMASGDKHSFSAVSGLQLGKRNHKNFNNNEFLQAGSESIRDYAYGTQQSKNWIDKNSNTVFSSTTNNKTNDRSNIGKVRQEHEKLRLDGQG